jgi:hypothetical protein
MQQLVCGGRGKEPSSDRRVSTMWWLGTFPACRVGAASRQGRSGKLTGLRLQEAGFVPVV